MVIMSDHCLQSEQKKLLLPRNLFGDSLTAYSHKDIWVVLVLIVNSVLSMKALILSLVSSYWFTLLKRKKSITN